MRPGAGIAPTATADSPTRGEIVERPALEQVRQFVSSFDRANIRYRVMQKSEPFPARRRRGDGRHRGVRHVHRQHSER